MVETSTSSETSRSPGRLLSIIRDRPLVRKYPAEIICALLLLVMGANLLSLLGQKTITNDELVHIPAGYRYLVASDFRVNPEHPPLIKMLAAAPLLLIKPDVAQPIDTNVDFELLTINSSVRFWHSNIERFAQISFWARVPMVLLTLLLGVLIFLFGRGLFGSRAAVFSVLLFSFEPTMLAHGTIVHTDIPSALAALIFLFALQAYWRVSSLLRAAMFGAAFSLAILTKFSLLIVVPLFVAVLLFGVIRAPRRGLPASKAVLHAGLAIVVAIFLINAAYKFQNPPLTHNDLAWIEGNPQVGGAKLKSLITNGPRFVPVYYLFGVYSVAIHNAKGHPTSLLGNYSPKGWWYYFPTVFALKTTIPFLLLSIAGLCWCLSTILIKRQKTLVIVVTPVIIYMAISMMSNINIGVRHLAPLFPFLFLMGGALLDQLFKTRKLGRLAPIVGLVLLGWMIFVAIRAYPDYLSYTSPLMFGRQNWEALSDSNIEWGQDVGALARYLHERGETRVGAALSGGWVTLHLYGIQYINLFNQDEVARSPSRYVAIGAGFLNGSTVPAGIKGPNGFLTDDERVRFFASYRDQKPEAVFGNSIYLFQTKN